MNGKFNNGLVVSVQSMNNKVLKAIKRNNLEINKIGDIYKEANRLGLPVATELIMPLPGETLETWKQGIVELLGLGQHNGVEVYQLQILENTELNLEQRISHNIKSIEAYGYMNNSAIGVPEEYPESISVVTETGTMPYEDMVKAYMFFWLINTFHVSGLAQLYARFLNKHHNIGYDEFYDKLEKYFDNIEWYQKAKSIVETTYRKWLNDGQPTYIKIDDVGMNHLIMSFHTVINLHHLENHDEVHGYIENFISENYTIEPMLLQDLQILTRNYVTKRSQVTDYPKVLSLNTNIIDYLFTKINKIDYSDYSATVSYTEDINLPKSIYLENIYFGRRRAFGKNSIKQLITNSTNLFEITKKREYNVSNA
jgi:hypothetical protein